MKTIRFITLLVLLLAGCNSTPSQESSFNSENIISSSISNSFETSNNPFVDPEFDIRVYDCLPSHYELDVGTNLNLDSTYTFCLRRNNKDCHPFFSDIRLKYDESAFEIIDCIVSEQSKNNSEYYPYSFLWSLKPLKEIESSLIEVFYQNQKCASTNLSVKDLTIESSSCSTTEKEFDYISSTFTGEITIFDNLISWEDYRKVHKELTYIKNEPNILTFENYEYALVTVSRDNLGYNPKLNGVFVQNETLYYDLSSEREYFYQIPDPTFMTTQSYYLCLLRYPSKLNVKNHQVWYSYIYKTSN